MTSSPKSANPQQTKEALHGACPSLGGYVNPEYPPNPLAVQTHLRECLWKGHALIDAVFDRLEAAEGSGGLWECKAGVLERQLPLPCGHAPRFVVQADEGTAHCSECERIGGLERELVEARNELGKCAWHKAIEEATEDAAIFAKERDEARTLHDEHCEIVHRLPPDEPGPCIPPWRKP
jgi:hypothetical protein